MTTKFSQRMFSLFLHYLGRLKILARCGQHLPWCLSQQIICCSQSLRELLTIWPCLSYDTDETKHPTHRKLTQILSRVSVLSWNLEQNHSQGKLLSQVSLKGLEAKAMSSTAKHKYEVSSSIQWLIFLLSTAMSASVHTTLSSTVKIEYLWLKMG